MKLLVYGINYHPELTGIGKYTTEMCEWLVSNGHSVEVITSMPYYPQWKIQAPYKGKKWHTEIINGVIVHRSPFYVPDKVTGLTRLLHEFSFMLSSFVHWIPLFTKKSFDLVIAIYPPLPIGVMPFLYKRIKKTPFIFHVQDLQVDAAKQLKIIKQVWLLSFLEKIEKFFMKEAHFVSTISIGMKNKIAQKGVLERKLEMFPNWVDTKLFRPMSDQKESLKIKYGYQGSDKVVLYSGNIGEKQGLDHVLKAAHVFQNEGLDYIQFFIVGDGAYKKKLMETKNYLNLKNVRFGDLVPKEELPSLLNMADLHLILQKKGASDLFMPSKLWSILSCGGIPLVAAEEGSGLRSLIDTNRIGLTCKEESPDALVDSIKNNLNLEDKEYKNRSRQWIMDNIDFHKVMSDFTESLKKSLHQMSSY